MGPYGKTLISGGKKIKIWDLKSKSRSKSPIKVFFMLFVIAIYLYFTLQPIKKNIELLKYMLLEVNKQSFSQ